MILIDDTDHVLIFIWLNQFIFMRKIVLFNEIILINNRFKIIALSVGESKAGTYLTSQFCNQDHRYNIKNKPLITNHKKSSTIVELFEQIF